MSRYRVASYLPRSVLTGKRPPAGLPWSARSRGHPVMVHIQAWVSDLRPTHPEPEPFAEPHNRFNLELGAACVEIATEMSANSQFSFLPTAPPWQETYSVTPHRSAGCCSNSLFCFCGAPANTGRGRLLAHIHQLSNTSTPRRLDTWPSLLLLLDGLDAHYIGVRCPFWCTPCVPGATLPFSPSLSSPSSETYVLRVWHCQSTAKLKLPGPLDHLLTTTTTTTWLAMTMTHPSPLPSLTLGARGTCDQERSRFSNGCSLFAPLCLCPLLPRTRSE
jgi:hypothetical protein